MTVRLLNSGAIPGCATPGCVFVGQREDPFFIAVDKVFDLFNLKPLGAENAGHEIDLEGKNLSTLAMELPITSPGSPPRP